MVSFTKLKITIAFQISHPVASDIFRITAKQAFIYRNWHFPGINGVKICQNLSLQNDTTALFHPLLISVKITHKNIFLILYSTKNQSI